VHDDHVSPEDLVKHTRTDAERLAPARVISV